MNEQLGKRALLELEHIENSDYFSKAASQLSILRYLIERYAEGAPAGRYKEGVIGVDCLGKKPGYDTHEDTIVRVTIDRLRKKLELYYATPTGSARPLRFKIETGSYIPQLIDINASASDFGTAPKPDGAALSDIESKVNRYEELLDRAERRDAALEQLISDARFAIAEPGPQFDGTMSPTEWAYKHDAPIMHLRSKRGEIWYWIPHTLGGLIYLYRRFPGAQTKVYIPPPPAKPFDLDMPLDKFFSQSGGKLMCSTPYEYYYLRVPGYWYRESNEVFERDLDAVPVLLKTPLEPGAHDWYRAMFDFVTDLKFEFWRINRKRMPFIDYTNDGEYAPGDDSGTCR